MKNNLKKITASIMAAASLAISATGFMASAVDVTTPVEPGIVDEYQGPETNISFGNGAHARAYADDGQINLATEAQSSTITATVRLNAAGYRTINEIPGTNYSEVGSVYRNYYGSGIKSASGYHEANGYSQSTYRSVG